MAKKDHVKDLSRILHFYQKTGYLCDTILVAEDGQVKVHSPVLAASSSLFRKSLRHGSSPTLHVIVLPGVDLFVARVIVHFVYTGVIVVPVKYALAGHMKTLVEVLMTLQLISESEAQSYLSKNVLSKVLSRIPASSNMMSIRSSDIRSSDATEAKSSEVPCSVTPQSVIETKAAATNSITTSYWALHTDTVGSSEGSVLQTNNCVGSGLTSDKMTSLLFYTGPASTSAADMLQQASNLTVSPGTGNSLSSNLSSRVLSLSALKIKPQEKQNWASSPGTDIATDSSSLPFVCGQEACWFCGELHRCQPSYYCEKAFSIKCEQKQRLRFSLLCEYCGMVVRRASKYNVHLATHLGNKTKSVEGTYPCEKCGRILNSLFALRRHLRKHLKKYVCEVCSVGYIQKKSLKQHQLDRHGIFTKSQNPNAFNAQQCSVCLRRFVCRQNFTLHMLRHTRERAHTCEFCARHYATKKGLKHHMVNFCKQLKYRC